ncbi:MAG: GNAT family N-acetyltransferase [Candidatus Bipolaricaulia bacterium]
MSLRAFKLPADLRVAVKIIPATFQYPENEAWSVQSDEKEEFIDTMNRVRRLWPVFGFAQLVSPALRDVFLGHVWEEDGQPVGMINFQRRGTTDTWYISNVGVLPNYRRQGIARKLVQVSLDLIRERGGKIVLLDVIAGNLPAYTLYEQLGFEHFSGSVKLSYQPDKAPPNPPLPDGYTIAPLSFFDWHTHYELEQRITPADIQKYEPVEVGRFRQPRLMRPLLPLVRIASGTRAKEITIRTAKQGRIVGQAGYEVRVRPGGVNHIDMRLDPAHEQLAPYLVQHLLNTALQLSPGRRIESKVPQWQAPVIAAAYGAGFMKRYEFHRMGIAL